MTQSLKMLPVMLWIVEVAGTTYKSVDWCVAPAVIGGVT